MNNYTGQRGTNCTWRPSCQRDSGSPQAHSVIKQTQHSQQTGARVFSRAHSAAVADYMYTTSVHNHSEHTMCRREIGRQLETKEHRVAEGNISSEQGKIERKFRQNWENTQAEQGERRVKGDHMGVRYIKIIKNNLVHHQVEECIESKKKGTL